MKSATRIRMRFVAPLRQKTAPRPLVGDISFLPMEAIGDDGTYDHESVRPASEVADSGYTYFEQGDVVRARVTPCFENGKGALLTSLAGARGLGTTELFVFRPSRKIVDRYLYYVTTSQEFTEYGTATLYGAHGVRRVDDQFARDYRVWLPPLRIQCAIADHLDRETARIDGLIAAKQRMMQLLEERDSIAFERVIKDYGFSFPVELQPHWGSGSIPAGWKVMRLSLVLDQLTNGYVGPTRDILMESGVPYIQSLNIKNGRIDVSKREFFVSRSWHNERPRIHLLEGDVLIVQTGDIGQVAVVPEGFGEASCHALQIARVNRKVMTGPYLGSYLRSSFAYHSLLSRA